MPNLDSTTVNSVDTGARWLLRVSCYDDDTEISWDDDIGLFSSPDKVHEYLLARCTGWEKPYEVKLSKFVHDETNGHIQATIEIHQEDSEGNTSHETTEFGAKLLVIDGPLMDLLKKQD
jgi:hypothetical protein